MDSTSAKSLLSKFHSKSNQTLIEFDTKANDIVLKMIKDRNWKKSFEFGKTDGRIVNDVEVAYYPQWRIFTRGNDKLALILASERELVQRDFTKDGLIKIVQPTWDVSKAKPPKYKNLIIVTYKKLGNIGKQYLNQQSKSKFLKIEHFKVEDVRINPTEYILQPKFTKLSQDDISIIEKKYGDLLKLPIMRIEDPISRWYDYKNGDIIKITRNIPNLHIYYRRVSAYEPDIEEELQQSAQSVSEIENLPNFNLDRTDL